MTAWQCMVEREDGGRAVRTVEAPTRDAAVLALLADGHLPIAVTSGEPSLLDRLLRRGPSLAARLGRYAVDPALADPHELLPPHIAAALATDLITAPTSLFEAVLQEEHLRADFRQAIVLPTLVAIVLVATAAIGGSGLATLALAAAALATLWHGPVDGWRGFDRIVQLPVAAALVSLGRPLERLADLVPDWAQPAFAEARARDALAAMMTRLASVETALLRSRLRRIGAMAWGGVLLLALVLVQGRSIG